MKQAARPSAAELRRVLGISDNLSQAARAFGVTPKVVRRWLTLIAEDEDDPPPLMEDDTFGKFSDLA